MDVFLKRPNQKCCVYSSLSLANPLLPQPEQHAGLPGCSRSAAGSGTACAAFRASFSVSVPPPLSPRCGRRIRAVQALRCVVHRHRPNGKCSRTVAFLLLGGEKLDFLSLCEEKLKEFCRKKGERASEAEKAGKQP